MEPVRVFIGEQVDVAIARLRARELARREGMARAVAEAMVIAISEVAQNIATHAGSGEIAIAVMTERGRRGLVAVARDAGPGIADLDRAMEDGTSSAGTLGLGLPGARRMVDEFSIVSCPGEGTVVVMKKWEQ
jgi:serine/threonine-protein kinase RsbT